MVVESPSKAKTIQQYLGKGFEVIASYGHVRDLIPKGGAVKVDGHEVQMKYQLVSKNKNHIDNFIAKAEKASTILLATDPDREGEAIAFHLLEILSKSIDLSDKAVKRVVFYEITKNSVHAAVEQARELDMNLVDAQQARRALDYLVGFSLSPVLWRKVKPGLSAGRVQSPALRMIADREKEILSFQSREYWSLIGSIKHKRTLIDARLTHAIGSKLSQFSVTNEEDALKTKAQIMQESSRIVSVENIVSKKRKRQPSPVFTTSTLQQESARKLNLSTAQTMRTAQQLYEGVAFDSENTALITYMRTDSVAMSSEAVEQAREHILNEFGKDYIPGSPRKYKNKTKNAQEAHEGIRPTDFSLTPQIVKKHLSNDQFKLYKLIWERAITSQMSDAQFEDQILTLSAKNNHKFEARRSHMLFPGFLKVYQEGIDDQASSDDDFVLGAPFEVSVGQDLTLNDILLKQHFTEAPPRFTEASLVKGLEHYGIGRPSTYASIISTLKTRGYVDLKQKRFYPTDTGSIVNDFLVKYFVTYVDYPFTAKMEDLLDKISVGESKWGQVVCDFWEPFSKIVKHVTDNISKKEVTEEKTDELCPQCESPLVKKFGKAGRFIACTGYPACSYTRAIDKSGAEQEPVPELDRDCPSCHKKLIYKRGRFGMFIGCSGYPDCKHIESLNKPKDTGVQCPLCNQGNIIEKKARRGSIFYSCSTYPKCNLAISGYPVDKHCPQCQHPLMMIKVTKRYGKQLACANKLCKYTEQIKEVEDE